MNILIYFLSSVHCYIFCVNLIVCWVAKLALSDCQFERDFRTKQLCLRKWVSAAIIVIQVYALHSKCCLYFCIAIVDDFVKTYWVCHCTLVLELINVFIIVTYIHFLTVDIWSFMFLKILNEIYI